MTKMNVNWRAVLGGFVVATVLGLVSGASMGGATLPFVGSGLASVIAGFVAGYLAGGTMANGALNGGLATVVGALAVLVVLTVTGVLFAGAIEAFAVLTVGVAYLLVYAIPGAIGGVLGAIGKGRRARRKAARPAA